MCRPLQLSFVIACFTLSVGCQEQVDFSKPPERVSELRSKASTSPASRSPASGGAAGVPADSTAADKAETARTTQDDSPTSENGSSATVSEPGRSAADVAATEPPGTASSPAAAAPDRPTAIVASGNENDDGQSLGVLAANAAEATETARNTDTNESRQETPASASDHSGLTARQNPVASAERDELLTASGRTAADVERRSEESKNESVGSAGLSLLESLRLDDDDRKVPATRAGRLAAQTLARTGRFAIAAETWIRLQNGLARRFHVSATSSGSRIAASSGERSLGVLSTHVEVLGEESFWTATSGIAPKSDVVMAVRRDKKEITTQPVIGLPGTITCIELLDGGDVVVVGTADGRLIARSSANLQNWDIYAQDLFAFLDERRPMSKLSESAVVVARAIDEDHLLTVTQDDQCQIWLTPDVVHQQGSVLDLTEEQAATPEAPVLTAQPLHTVALQDSVILNLFFSKSRKLVAIVTSGETITVLNTQNGSILDVVTSAQLDDTQPVSGILEEDRGRIVVGLADGRIIRRALAGGEPVTGTDVSGNTVDYETLFAPEPGDNSGAITAMEAKHDGTVTYIGRLDGTLSQFDLARKQIIRTDRKHDGPIIEIRSTPAGVFTIGEDRVAKLSDTPGVENPATVAETFPLPRDQYLASKEVIETAATQRRNKNTINRNFGRDITAASGSLELTGIRSTDPVLALYEHQLRVEPAEEKRQALRKKINTIRNSADGPGGETDQTGSESDSASAAGADLPARLCSIPSEFDFKSRPIRRVVLSLSDDAGTLAAAQYLAGRLMRGAAPDQPVIVWDTQTGSRLRAWKRSTGVYDLNVDRNAGVVLPTPVSATMHLLTGEFQAETRTALSWERARDGNTIIVGLTGVPGMATNVIAARNLQSGQSTYALEAFEGAVPAIASSSGGYSLFVCLRERTQFRLLEVNPDTLQIIAEVYKEELSGPWDVSRVAAETDVLGPTHILPSPSGKLLVTYGRHADGDYQLRIWKKSGERWPVDDCVVIPSQDAMLETKMTDTQMVFVDQKDYALALIGVKGAVVIDTRKGKVLSELPLPDVDDHRPATVLSGDGNLLLAGDWEGRVWSWNLRNLNRKPTEFKAHAGPIIGLAVSANSRYLATAGEENRLRVWELGEE